MQRITNFLSKYSLLIIVLGCIPAMKALLVPGYYGASDDLHIAWLFELDKALRAGQIPPRWAADLSFGFGYPLFNFVFPLPFYLGEIFHLLGFNLVDSIKLVFLISFPISAYFMFFLLREYATVPTAVVGALMYVYIPYRATDVYVRGAIGEIVSFAILPVLVFSFLKILRTGYWRWVGGSGLAFAGLVLSHNITALMFVPFLGVLLILILIISKRRVIDSIKFLSALLLGLLISSYFWFPALFESSLMKYDTVFNYVDHYPTIRQLFLPYWGYGASVPGPGDGMSFYLGGASLAVMLFGVGILMKKWHKIALEQRLISVWVIGGVLISLGLMNYRSVIIWQTFPLLPYFQFPWRFLIMMTFFAPVFLPLIDKLNFKLKGLSLAAILFLVFIAAPNFHPHDFLGRDDQYYLDRYIPTPQVNSAYLAHQEEYLRLPKETDQRPDRLQPLVVGEGVYDLNNVNDFYTVFRVKTLGGVWIDYNRYNFPGWKVEVDGVEVAKESAKPYGQIRFYVSGGEHLVEVYYEETKLKVSLNAISLLGFLVSLSLLLNLWKQLRRTGRFWQD